MENKRVLIQIGTEFHFLVSLSIIENYFPEGGNEITFLVSMDPEMKSKRLLELKPDERFKVVPLRYEYMKGNYYNDVFQMFQEVKNLKYTHFVSFLYHDPVFIAFSYFFKKRKMPVFLVPDGMGAYVRFTKLTLRSRLISTIRAYQFFIIHKMFFFKPFFISWDFGHNGYYERILAYSRSVPSLKNQSKVEEINYVLSKERIKQLLAAFSINLDYLAPFEKFVIIANERHNNEEYERKLLDLINLKIPGIRIIFKKHPNQPAEKFSFLKEYNNVIYIEEIFPLEILIAMSKKSMIISSYSASMLYYDAIAECNYIWTYPLLEGMGILKKPIKRYHPKEHIKVVYSFDALSDEFEKFYKSL